MRIMPTLIERINLTRSLLFSMTHETGYEARCGHCDNAAKELNAIAEMVAALEAELVSARAAAGVMTELHTMEPSQTFTATQVVALLTARDAL